MRTGDGNEGSVRRHRTWNPMRTEKTTTEAVKEEKKKEGNAVEKRSPLAFGSQGSNGRSFLGRVESVVVQKGKEFCQDRTKYGD